MYLHNAVVVIFSLKVLVSVSDSLHDFYFVINRANSAEQGDVQKCF